MTAHPHRKFSAFRRRLLTGLGVLVAFLVPSLSHAALITVGKPDDPSTMRSVQKALAQCHSGDTIRVYGGTYQGNLHIKTGNIVIEGIDNPVIQGEKAGNAVTLEADKVTLRGLIIRGGGRLLLKDNAGIKLIKAKECVIENNRLEDNLHGMYLKGAEKCIVANNVIRGRAHEYQENRGNGIHLWDAPFNVIERNDIADARDGIYVSFAHHCRIDYNKIHRTRYGLHYMYSNHNSFAYNTLVENVAGAAVMYGKHIEFTGNLFARNRGFRAYGILWQDVRRSKCRENLVMDNTIGLHLDQAGFSEIFRNSVVSNDVAAVVLENSEENVLYENNFVSNLSLLRLRGGTQYGRNNLFYKNGRGNYWSGYRGYDLNDDGIGDQPYALEGVFDVLEADYPEFRLFLFSPMATAVSLAEKAFPIIELPVTAEDKFPLMRPALVTGPPAEAIAKSGLRNCAEEERAVTALLCFLLFGASAVVIWKGAVSA